jgi:hypothetical protein
MSTVTTEQMSFDFNETKPTISPSAHAATITNIALNCQEVTYACSWFSQSKQVDAKTKFEMVSVVSGQSKGFGVSKKLLTSGHPLLSELSTCRRNIHAWRDAFTIVKANAANDTTIEGGVRLIRVEDMEEFERGFFLRRDQLYSAADRVTEHLNVPYTDADGTVWDSILDLDRQRLGDQFNLRDYPDSLRQVITVSDPVYTAYKPSVRLPAAIYQRECSRVASEIDRTIQTATDYITSELQTAFETLANQLVQRTRVHPHEMDTEIVRFTNAEVVRQTVNGDNITVELKYAVDGDKKVTEVLTMPTETFKTRFCPVETEERKRITTSTIQHIMEKLNGFGHIRSMLGAQGVQMDAALDQIRAQFSRVGGRSEEIAHEIKSSRSFRKSLATALTSSVETLLEQAEDVKKVRRAVNLDAIKLWEKD